MKAHITTTMPALALLALATGCGWVIGMQKARLEPEDATVDGADADSEGYEIDAPDRDGPQDGPEAPEDAEDAPEEVVTPCDSSEDCDDKDPCNGEETCVDHVCQPGTPLEDGDACVLNIVVFGICQGGVCIPQTCRNRVTDPGEECDDGGNLDQDDGCRPNCRFSCHRNSDCNDGNVCTTDLCQTVGNLRLCQHPPNHDPCDDGSECTREDRCEGGTCSGGIPIVCDDLEECTTDSCDPLTGCTIQPVELPADCDDGNGCTSDEECNEEGVCTPGSTCDCSGIGNCDTWDDDNPCNGTLSCNTTTGMCDLNPFTGCPGSTDCRKKRCVPDPAETSGFRCEDQDEPDETPCNDSNLCTLDDACIDGECMGSSEIDCDDQNPCTTDSCSPLSGCMHLFNTETCSTNLFCNVMEACSNGECVGIPLQCTDRSECTADFCDEVADTCVFVPLPNDRTPCGANPETDCCIDGECAPCTSP